MVFVLGSALTSPTFQVVAVAPTMSQSFARDRPVAMPTKILIVDDDEMVGQLLSQWVTEKISGAIVQVCESSASALRILANTSDSPFSLVVLDLLLDGESSGPITVSKLRAKHPSLPLLAMSSLYGSDIVAEVFRYGANGFVPKRCSPTEFITAVQTVLAGKVFVQDEMRDLAIVSKGASSTPLTAQHLRIVAMLGQGMSDKKIAAAEGISEDTVAFHVRTIFRVLGAATRAQAVAKAYQAGFFRIRRPAAHGTHP